MDTNLSIIQAIENSIKTKSEILNNKESIILIEDISREIVKAFKSDKKVLFCGNGGSAADAQHLAAELSGKFYLERPPLPAEALHVNSSFLTAVANDYSYDQVFERVLEGAGREGDVLVAISTSGNSANVVKAIKKAKEKKMVTVGLTGESGGQMKEICDFMLRVPSADTPRIQEAHILMGHIICEIVEKEIFGENKTI
jgi:D-sedoheptulose 7-phosphate isomerase